MLSASERRSLEEKLVRFEKETSNQVIVATFSGLEGEVLEDYAIRLAQAWKPGQKDRDNGVILLIFKKDREVRLEVGYGLEGALPDAAAKQIIENKIIPEFRQGNFSGGIEKGVDAVIAAARGEYQPKKKEAFFLPSIFFGVLSLIVGVLAFMTAAGQRGYYLGGSSGRGSWSSGGGFRGGGGSFGGGGASGRW